MDHLLRPLENLRQEVDFFAREESLRLLHAVVDPVLRAPALDVLRAMQWSPGNKQVVFVLEFPTDLRTARWDAWSEQSLAAFANIRDAYSKAGVTLDEIGLPGGVEPVIRFAAVLKAAADALGGPPAKTNGITVIFATSDLREPHRWLAFLDEIVNRTPSLNGVRWGWMETGSAVGNEFVRALGDEKALHVECRVDPGQQREELEDLLAAMAEASDEAVGPVAAGAAAPTAAPPRHPTDPPKASSPAPARQVNRMFLQGLQALRAGDINEAVRLQNLAFQQCLSAKNLPLAVEMEMLLATYVVQAAGGEKESLHSALKVFQSASARAYEGGQPVAGAKIDLILAPMAKLVGEFELAGQSLRRAADAARSPAPALSIESLRLASDFMLETGNPTKAKGLLGEALEIVTSMPPAEARQTSAAKCAEALAAILRGEGKDSQAQDMEALAKRLDGGLP